MKYITISICLFAFGASAIAQSVSNNTRYTDDNCQGKFKDLDNAIDIEKETIRGKKINYMKDVCKCEFFWAPAPDEASLDWAECKRTKGSEIFAWVGGTSDEFLEYPDS